MSTMKTPHAFEFHSIPQANSLTQIGMLDSNFSFGTFHFMALNDGVTNARIKIAISKSSNPSGVERFEYIESGDIIEPNGKVTNFGITVPGNRYLYVQSDTGSVIFRATCLAQPA